MWQQKIRSHYFSFRNLKSDLPPRNHARSPRFVVSPFVQALDACLSIDVWATPSIIPGLHVPIKTGEYSISMNGFGSHLDNTGLLGDVAKRASKLRFSDQAIMTSSGTTSSNHKVMLMLHSEFKDRPILVSRNCHHSVILSAQMYGVKLCFINNPPWLDQFDAMLPPTANDVKLALQRHPNACAVLISSPTYEGIIANIEEIAHVVHTSSDAILWVDQAWGSHLGTSTKTPKSAMQLGADVVCESLHKNGGALQGAALLLWKQNGMISDRAMFEAHVKEETTSPNFNIFASIDSALLRLQREPELVDDLCDLIAEVKDRLSDEPELTFLDKNSSTSEYHLLQSSNPYTSTQQLPPLVLDPTRLCLSFNGRSGSEIRHYLEQRAIEVEKIGRQSILLIATFQLPLQASEHVTRAISQALHEQSISTQTVTLPSPYNNSSIDPLVIDPMNEIQIEKIPFLESKNMISDETVECYPPGIPIIIPGFPISAESIDYLLKMKELNSTIIASDSSLETIRVRKLVPIRGGKEGGEKSEDVIETLNLIL
jgi:arginine decarboxylase